MTLADWIVDRWKPILAIGLVATVLGVWPASELGLVTDLPALLPAGSPAADDYRRFIDRFGGLERVFIVVLPATEGPAVASASVVDAAEALAVLLADSPEVAAVRSGIEPGDEDFLLEHVIPRGALLADGDWETRLEQATEPEALRERVAAIRAAVLSPFGAPQRFLEADPLGLTANLALFRSGASRLPVDPFSMTFLSSEGSASLVVVTPARAEMDPEGGRALAAELEAAFASVREALGAELVFAAVGGPLYAAHDEAVLRNDLKWTLIGSLTGCTLLVVLAFGSVALPLATLLPLTAGLVATFALLRFGAGSVSSIGVGFAAVLVGLGIDYGIHSTTRFCQFRIRGRATAAAIDGTIRGAGPAILTSTSTTAAAFVVLAAAQVRPIRELGLVVAIGIVAIFVATATLGGAALVALDRGGRVSLPSGVIWRAFGHAVDASVRVASRRPNGVIAVAAVLTVTSIAGLTRFRLDADLRSLRPAGHPTVEAETLLTEHFPVPLDTTTVIVQGRDLAEALERADAAETLLHESLGDEASITSPTSWLGVPSVIRERLELLKTSRLKPAIGEFERQLDRAGLEPGGLALGLGALADLADGRDPGMPPRETWPDWLAELVAVGPDDVSVAIRVRLPHGVWPDGPPVEFRSRLAASAGGGAVASVPAVARELRERAGRDLARLGLGALLVVLVVVLVSFRGNARRALLSLAPVLLGSLWSLGLWSLCGNTLDILGAAVLPIILGIGVDDGLHAVHGASRERGRIGESVRESGRAMVLTTLTTSIGFGSLVFSHLPGLRKSGLLVVCGVIACLAATLLVLPALEARMRGRS
jgi:predicted RND superfamily exporter protein